MIESIQKWTSKICGKQPLKNSKGYGLRAKDFVPYASVNKPARKTLSVLLTYATTAKLNF